MSREKLALCALGVAFAASAFFVTCCMVPTRKQWAATAAHARNLELKLALEERFPGSDMYVASVEDVQITVYRWPGELDERAQGELRDWLTAWRAERGATWPIRLTLSVGKQEQELPAF